MSDILKLKRGSVVEYTQIEDTADISTLYFASSDGTFDKPEIKTELHIGSSKVTDFDNMNEVEILYDDLVSLRDEGNLIPGMQYRIIDFVTTCNAAGIGSVNVVTTRSAGHAFDIILIADSADTLNVNARAVIHDGDTYFAASNLAMWQLKYSIDNDTSRFTWAVPESEGGRGVIYYMKDEFDNECFYDFKNIQYVHTDDIILDGTTLLGNSPYYTFTANDEDASCNSTGRKQCHDNVITMMLPGNSNTMYLLDTIFIGESCYGNIINNGFQCYFGENCRNINILGDSGNIISGNKFGNGCDDITLSGGSSFGNTFGKACSSIHVAGYSNTFSNDCNNITLFGEKNTFGQYCTYITLPGSCSYNTFGEACRRNTFGRNCSHNTFSAGCQDNTLGYYCVYNVFGESCLQNTIDDNSSNNTFGAGCSFNTLGKECDYNIFGDDFKYNTMGNSNSYNTFGNACHSNSLGNSCHYNIFGNEFNYNDLGNSCYGNTFRKEANLESSLLDNVLWCRFDQGCSYIVLYANTTGNDEIKHLHITAGVKGAEGSNKPIEEINTPLYINIPKNTEYQVKIAVNSSGDVKIYCEADLIQ